MFLVLILFCFLIVSNVPGVDLVHFWSLFQMFMLILFTLKCLNLSFDAGLVFTTKRSGLVFIYQDHSLFKERQEWLGKGVCFDDLNLVFVVVLCVCVVV